MIALPDESALPGQPSYLLLYSRGRWIGCLLVGCFVPLLIILGGLVALIVSALAHRTAEYLAVGTLVLGAIVVIGVLTWGIVGMARPPMAWLEATTVVVRGFFSTKRCDLATAAAITVDSYPEMRSMGQYGAVPTGRMMFALRVQYSVSERSLRVLLRHPNNHRLLEPVKLHALAYAMLAGPRRVDPAAQQWIERIAQGLHEMADDPFAGLR